MKRVSSYICASILGAGLCLTQQVLADAVDTEQNHPVSLAQFITPGAGEFHLSGVLGVVSGPAVDDVDFFRFYAQAGDVVTIDIDGAYGGLRSFDSWIALFSSGPEFKRLVWNDDAYPPDEGSRHWTDSRIVDHQIMTTGTYYVAVSHYGRDLQDGAAIPGGYPRNGDYQLIISGASNKSVQHMKIAIKPGDDEIKPLNPRARGRIPVALLSGNNFDPKDVVVDSLTFGHEGKEESLKKCHKPNDDLNGDGVNDMVCHFDNQLAAFQKGDSEGVLRGELKDGTEFQGKDMLKVVPEKAR